MTKKLTFVPANPAEDPINKSVFNKLSPETQELITSHITTVKFVLKKHEEICKEARDLVEIKGKDYNRQEQQESEDGTGDTLANMRLAKNIGLAD